MDGIDSKVTMYQQAPSRLQEARYNPFYRSGVVSLISGFNPDRAIGLILFGAGLYAYIATLGPTVLEGDAALFQFTPYVLGVTYPTGFPLYILLGKIWLLLFPFGEIAWRMNLFSALCSAAALPLIYGAARRLLAPPLGPLSSNRGLSQAARWAALVAALLFATLPTFWRWSTEAKTYALNILLFSAALYLLALALERQNHHRYPEVASQSSLFASRFSRPISQFIRRAPLAMPALLLGLQISVHNTAVLLIPGLFLLAWLNFRQDLRSKTSLLVYLALLVAPGLFYLYIPLRAEWLIAQYGRVEAIERGLLADFYYSGLDGLLRYFAATDFTGGVATNWGLVPQQIFTVYVPELLVDNVTALGAGLGLVGGLALAIMQPRLFWPFFLIYLVPIPFVLTYGQGEQSAFLLPSFLIFSIFAGNALILIQRLLMLAHTQTFGPSVESPVPAALQPSGSPVTLYLARLALPLLTLALILTLVVPQIRYNINWLDAKWSRAIYDEWADALDHPLEPGAAVLAHWGDLTPFWYMQYAEGRRPDLRGLYPPTEEIVNDYLQRGGNLYIAGPLQGWADGIEERYQLIPWGRLVRIAPHQVDPQTLLPPLSQSVEAVFDGKLRLVAVDYPARAAGDSQYAVTLTWQTLAELPPEATISLRLSRGDGIVVQLDDTLLSGWFPRQTLPAGQYVLSYMPMHIPLGTLPGEYRLQLAAYTNYRQPWPLATGATLLDLGKVEIISPPADYRPDSDQFHAISGYDFNGEIELVDHEYNVSRVGQGKGFAVKLIWRARTKPVDNYTLLVEVVDAGGNILRSVEHQPAAGQAPTASWQAGQFVRDQIDLVLPASAPVGPKSLRVRLSWLRPDGSRLAARRWWLPVGDRINLEWLEVIEKEERVFEAPVMQYPIGINLENKVRLLGYNSPQLSGSGAPGQPDIQVSLSRCLAEPQTCRIHFDFYWEGLSEMDALYFVFVHLVDAEGQIVAQHDRSPGVRGKQPTTSWLPGEIVADPVDLTLSPGHLAPGHYTLRTGMYLPPDGPRLLVWDTPGQAGVDFVEVGTVEVRP